MLLSTLFLFAISLLFFLFLAKKSFFSRKTTTSRSVSVTFPRSYPFIGSYLEIIKNRDRYPQWTSDLLQISPSGNFVLRRSLDKRTIFTVKPANVERVLKTHFHIYEKGGSFRSVLRDFLGDGIFIVDGDSWRFQRQIASHEFATRPLRKFVETVMEAEISARLIPILSSAAATDTVLDFQDILERFSFDNICKIAFGFDPAYLSPSFPEPEFAQAFQDSARISSERFYHLHAGVWKLKRFLRIGSEKRLRIAISEVREFARSVVREKKRELAEEKSSLESADLLSRFLIAGHSDEAFVIDIVIAFILAGRDSTSAALTWFFWLVAQNPEAENEIMREIGEKSKAPTLEEVKDMVYTHAALCESMRLYPPVPFDTKEAASDDVWEDGTVVKKGTRVTYHPYAMGRSEELWGPDWAEYRPERWLRKETGEAKWSFVARDAYTYPVFQAGPRVCLGRDMAFLQMKGIVASVMRRFRVVPATRNEPVYLTNLTSKMKGGFPVLIKIRS